MQNISKSVRSQKQCAQSRDWPEFRFRSSPACRPCRNVLYTITDLETAVNSDLEKLRKWLIANKLSLNVAKTEFMLIGSKQMIKNISNLQLNVKIENESIKQVYESKTLGVTIDQHLSWKTNTENICKKKTSGISALRRLKEFADK